MLSLFVITSMCFIAVINRQHYFIVIISIVVMLYIILYRQIFTCIMKYYAHSQYIMIVTQPGYLT